MSWILKILEIFPRKRSIISPNYVCRSCECEIISLSIITFPLYMPNKANLLFIYWWGKYQVYVSPLTSFSVHLRLISSVLNHDNLQWHIESKNSLQNYLPYIGLYKYVCYIFWISTLMIKRNNIYIHLSIANLWFIISWCRQNGDQLCIIIKH